MGSNINRIRIHLIWNKNEFFLLSYKVQIDKNSLTTTICFWFFWKFFTCKKKKLHIEWNKIYEIKETNLKGCWNHSFQNYNCPLLSKCFHNWTFWFSAISLKSFLTIYFNFTSKISRKKIKVMMKQKKITTYH